MVDCLDREHRFHSRCDMLVGSEREVNATHISGDGRRVKVSSAGKLTEPYCVYHDDNVCLCVPTPLRKLYRVPNSKARTRFLLILDASGNTSFPKSKLKQSFDGVRQEYGRFKRHPVTVLYVYPKEHYKFTWPS